MLAEIRAALPRRVLNPIVRVMAQIGITPNMLSWFGLILSVAAGGLAGVGYLMWAGWVSLIAGALDMFDGTLARTTGQATRFGAVLDSSLDRFGEAALLVGLAAYFVTQPNGQLWTAVTVAALMGSFMVSYVKARAEGMGISCDVGFFTRPERVIVMGVGLIAGFPEVAVALVAVAANLTAFHRLYHVWRQIEPPVS